jgi:hypothetical protein
MWERVKFNSKTPQASKKTWSSSKSLDNLDSDGVSSSSRGSDELKANDAEFEAGSEADVDSEEEEEEDGLKDGLKDGLNGERRVEERRVQRGKEGKEGGKRSKAAICSARSHKRSHKKHESWTSKRKWFEIFKESWHRIGVLRIANIDKIQNIILVS